jgi:hypothetical protein
MDLGESKFIMIFISSWFCIQRCLKFVKKVPLVYLSAVQVITYDTYMLEGNLLLSVVLWTGLLWWTTNKCNTTKLHYEFYMEILEAIKTQEEKNYSLFLISATDSL